MRLTLPKLQNRAARVITKSHFDTIKAQNACRNMVKWKKLSIKMAKQKAIIMYNSLYDLIPRYFY